MHRAYEKQSLQLLDKIIQERDEARGQLRELLDKLVASNCTTPDTEFLTTVLPQVSPESPLVNRIIPILSTTESNSFCEPYNYHSRNSSPVSSVFESVSSPELSSTHAGVLSNQMGFVNQPFVQDYESVNPTTVVPPPGALKIDEYIDSLVRGKTLPQKGNLWQSVLDAGPLLETLLVAGTIPKWRNPPPLSTCNIPSFTGKGGHVKIFHQKPTELSIQASRPENTQSYVEMPFGSQVPSNAVPQLQDAASRLRFGIGKEMSGANGFNSLSTGKRKWSL